MSRLAVVAAILLATPLAGMAAQGSPPDPEILRTVERLFDAMRARDTVALRAVLDSSARLVATGTQNGAPTVRVIPISQFVRGVGRAQVELDERIYEPVIHTHQNLASVWVRYEFRTGGQFSHCGYDAFQLFRSTEGWRIFAIADTRMTDGCPGR